ncbi:MAG: DUF3604 domain-containing protein [Acidobacteria bacterium]|nr:DUF3604 domain-containing protein [Acidobacteriota bacterium]
MRVRFAFAATMAALTTAAFAQSEISSTMVGHEFRQGDLPSIAAAPDGSMWTTWLSWNGARDDIAIRQHHDGVWSNLQWVPNTSGDRWLPQVGVDARGRVWVVWSQMAADGNWDLYARAFDPAAQTWGTLERLTSDPLPDINPRLASDGEGTLAVVWQAFRRGGGSGAGTAANSRIHLRTLRGNAWSGESWITQRSPAANHWEPSAAFAPNGELWIAYDSYRNGNYDVYLARANGEETAVATSARFEARPTVAVDTAGRVWVAWEAGLTNWGKDQGYILRAKPRGVQLGATRSVRVRCYDGGVWRDPAGTPAFGGVNAYQPHIFSDGAGSVHLAAKTRFAGAAPQPNRGYWQYQLTRYSGSAWSAPARIPNSLGRSSTRINGALDRAGAFWLTWEADGRTERFYHKPVRQAVHAGRVTTAAPPASLNWAAAPLTDVVSTLPGHADEAGDLRTVRAYTVKVSGRDAHIYRGDFHRHTEISWDGGGGADGSLQDFYRYMIDVVSMDFGASTDHQGGAWPYWWWYTLKMADMYNVPGTYTSMFGYERSAVYPNGHRNMIFVRRGDAKVTPFLLKAGVAPFALGQSPMGDDPGIGSGDLVENNTKVLYEEIRGRNAIAISHTSGTRMGTDWRDNDPDLEPVVEIFPGARTSYEKLGEPYVAREASDAPHMKQAGYQPQGMMNLAWRKGYKLGIITSSDHGSTHISYAMVYSPDPSRQGIVDAIRRRHTYGATDNIVLDVRMGSHFRGDEVALKKALPLKVRARGTGEVARVDVIKDSQIVYTAEPKSRDVHFEFINKGDVAARHYYYVRVLQTDGMIARSSPFFVNYK